MKVKKHIDVNLIRTKDYAVDEKNSKNNQRTNRLHLRISR